MISWCYDNVNSSNLLWDWDFKSRSADADPLETTFWFLDEKYATMFALKWTNLLKDVL